MPNISFRLNIIVSDEPLVTSDTAKFQMNLILSTNVLCAFLSKILL